MRDFDELPQAEKGGRLDPATGEVEVLWKSDEKSEPWDNRGRDFDPDSALRAVTDRHFVTRLIRYRTGEVVRTLDNVMPERPRGRGPDDFDDVIPLGSGPRFMGSGFLCFGVSLAMLLLAGYVSYRIGKGKT